MLTTSTLAEFSRTYCTEICGFLVPANCLVTLQTLILTGLGRPQWQIRGSIGAVILLALTMVLHVLTWWSIGVVRVPTFILLGLVILCLSCNAWALFHSHSLRSLLRWLWVYLATTQKALEQNAYLGKERA